MYTYTAYDFQTASVNPPHFLTIHIIREANIALKNPCYVMKSFPPGNRGGPKVQSYHMSTFSALSSSTLLCDNFSGTILIYPLNKPLT